VIKVRQELVQVDEILKEKREEQKIKRKYMDEQWEEARKQQLQLRQSLVKFNTLVKENVERSRKSTNARRNSRKKYGVDEENEC